MEKTKISAEIVGHSKNPQGDELISVLCTFPRIILSEMNTHRMLSKNTSSSRAIPFKKMVEAVKTNPFIPIAWQKHHSGMQGNEYWDVSIKEEIGGFDYTNIPAKWLRARDTAVTMAEVLHDGPLGVTKQLCNRLLEPFMWTTMLITGPRSGWDNFFSLRSPEYHLENIPTVNEDLSLSSETITLIGKSKKELLKEINQIDNDCYNGFKTIINNYSDLDWLKQNKGQAEIHIMDLAEKIYDAVNESTPESLHEGEWHIPFKNKFGNLDTGKLVKFAHITNRKANLSTIQTAIRVSVAMAARTSYTVVGEEKDIDYNKMIDLHDRLLTQDPPHSSPMEHCAQAMSNEEYYLFNKGQASIDSWSKSPDELFFTPDKRGWCRNFKGFIPYRHIVETKTKN